MFSHRRVDPVGDRVFLLDAHCELDFVCESEEDRQGPYDAYRDRWLRSGQPTEFLAALEASLEDLRTIADIFEDANGETVAYVWATFSDVPGYALVIAEINDLWVAPGHRRRGLGRRLMEHIVADAASKGAHRLRSGTGAGNAASLRLHEQSGFNVYRMEFERVLGRDQTE